MSKNKFSDKEVNDIIQDYTILGNTLRKIALKYKVDYRVIRRILKENNIKISLSYSGLKRDINEKYFDSINTGNKAYILGLLFSDGNLYKDTIKIKMHRDDRELLQRISTEIFGTVVLYEYNNEGYCTTFKISNVYMSNSLRKLGLQENKTYKKSNMDKIPYGYIGYFIKGMLDGDGTCGVYLTGENIFTRIFSIINADKNLLEEIKVILDNITGTSGNIGAKTYKEGYINGKLIKSTIPCYHLTYSGRSTMQKLYTYLYIDHKNVIFLHRKRQKLFNATLTPSELENLKII